MCCRNEIIKRFEFKLQDLKLSENSLKIENKTFHLFFSFSEMEETLAEEEKKNHFYFVLRDIYGLNIKFIPQLYSVFSVKCQGKIEKCLFVLDAVFVLEMSYWYDEHMTRGDNNNWHFWWRFWEENVFT